MTDALTQEQRAKATPPAKLWRNWIRFHYDDEPSSVTQGARVFPSKELAEQAWHELNDMGLSAVELSVGMSTEYLGAYPEGERPPEADEAS